MRQFRSTLIEVNGDGTPVIRTPLPFAGRVGETQLEEWLIVHPELAGEPLLVLGSQLADFAEDKDRLDVLAVDDSGELLLVELKVDESFRMTDLQALAYAGAYASLPTEHFASVLQKHLVKGGKADATIGDAKARIVSFLDIDNYDEWQPSMRVRIKLIAPGFPKRVLKNVKWLGDVYDMPIEAIEVKLFEDSAGGYHLTVERLLPLPGDDTFDMTVRDSEVRQQSKNNSPRPRVLTALLENGDIHDGQKMWFKPSGLYEEAKAVFDPENVMFQVKLDASGNTPRFRWRHSEDAPEESLWPSTAWHAVHEVIVPGKYECTSFPVHSNFTVSPNGQTLGELAESTGAWESKT